LAKAPTQSIVNYWTKEIEKLEEQLWKVENNPAWKDIQKHINSGATAQDNVNKFGAVPDSFSGGTFGKEKTQEEISAQITQLVKLSQLTGTAEKPMLKLGYTGQQILDKIRNAAINMAMDISMALGRAFAGAESDWGAMLLGGLGAMLIELGKIAMETSTLLEAIQKALMNPLGGGAMLFIAGAAAVALGSYFVSRSQSLVKDSAGTMGSGGSVRFGASNVNVSGQFTVKGSDLVLVLDKQGYNSGRTGG
jgi:hypothetical protein